MCPGARRIPSSYQELLDKDVPKVEKDGVHVAVIAGESMGVTSPVYTRTPTMYLSFRMQPGSHLRQVGRCPSCLPLSLTQVSSNLSPMAQGDLRSGLKPPVGVFQGEVWPPSSSVGFREPLLRGGASGDSWLAMV